MQAFTCMSTGRTHVQAHHPRTLNLLA